MAKRVKFIEKPNILLDTTVEIPLYRQVYNRIRAQILMGQLVPGARLPSTRTFASELGISRNTIALSYELLQQEGYIESRVGHGAHVAYIPPESWQKSPPSGRTQSVTDQRPVFSQHVQNLLNQGAPQTIEEHPMPSNPFLIGIPEVASFPYKIWTGLVTRHTSSSLQAHALYQNGQGYAPLRTAIATHIGTTRGVRCTPEQIILTAGAQGAFDLVARVLLDAGDVAWVEHPGYFGAYGALQAAGVKTVPVTVDEEGIDVEHGKRLAAHARLAVVTPSHQFPTGVTMSLSRRFALLAWAKQQQAWIIEDDYDSEYRFGGRPLEALQALDQAERVIYVGTFSKVLFPALRLGYLVTPRVLLPGFLTMRHLIDIHLPLVEQMALADFLLEGHFTRYIRKMRWVYLERRNAVVEALRQIDNCALAITVPEAGMHLVVWLPEGVEAQQVVEQAAQYGLQISSVSHYGVQLLQRDGLVLGFASSSPEVLRIGVQVLAHALQTVCTA
jgi:GntR family transcriptional regulator / MocR family aminotransferase